MYPVPVQLSGAGLSGLGLSGEGPSKAGLSGIVLKKIQFPVKKDLTGKNK